MPLQFTPFATNQRIVRAASNSPVMAIGERGPAVAIVQGALIDLGYSMPISTKKTGLPDGIYGRETKATVHKFQADKGLKYKDGIVGRETLSRLDQLLVAKFGSPQGGGPLAAPPPPVNRNYKIGRDDPRITPDPGAGPWRSKPVTVTAAVQRELILSILPPRGNSAALVIGDDAAAHMRHYLYASGRNYTIDLEGMIAEVRTAKRRFENEVNQAKQFVESLPVGTHDITSRNAESAYNRKSENWNWFFAIGGYSTWGKGRAEVRDGPSGREYQLEFEYKFYDRYNWDTGKKVEIMGITITDEFMGEFHRQGLAREFDCVGSIRRTFRWRQGQPIPPQQFLPPGGR